MMKKIITAILLIGASVFAQDMLAVDFVDYDEGKATYTVSKTYTVESDDALLIKAGQKLVFLPGAGIEVKGELIIDGRAGREVTLTSQNASESGMGAPSDWVGITLHPGSKAFISHARVAYATVGLNSHSEDFTLENTIFVANGTNLVIGGKTAKAADRQPINYDASQIRKFLEVLSETKEDVRQPDAVEPEVVAANDAKAKKEPKAKEPKPKKEPKVKAEKEPKVKREKTAAEKKATLKNTLRFAAATVAIGGITGGIICQNRSSDAYKKYKLEDDPTKKEEMKSDAQKKVDRNDTWGAIWYSLGAVGASGFALTFFF